MNLSQTLYTALNILLMLPVVVSTTRPEPHRPSLRPRLYSDMSAYTGKVDNKNFHKTHRGHIFSSRGNKRRQKLRSRIPREALEDHLDSSLEPTPGHDSNDYNDYMTNDKLAVKKALQVLHEEWRNDRKLLDAVRKGLLKRIKQLKNASQGVDRLLERGKALRKKTAESKKNSVQMANIKDKAFTTARKTFESYKKLIDRLENKTNSEELAAMMSDVNVTGDLEFHENNAVLPASIHPPGGLDKIVPPESPADQDTQSELKSNVRPSLSDGLKSTFKENQEAFTEEHNDRHFQVKEIEDNNQLPTDPELEHVDSMLNRILNRRVLRSTPNSGLQNSRNVLNKIKGKSEQLVPEPSQYSQLDISEKVPKSNTEHGGALFNKVIHMRKVPNGKRVNEYINTYIKHNMKNRNKVNQPDSTSVQKYTKMKLPKRTYTDSVQSTRMRDSDRRDMLRAVIPRARKIRRDDRIQQSFQSGVTTESGADGRKGVDRMLELRNIRHVRSAVYSHRAWSAMKNVNNVRKNKLTDDDVDLGEIVSKAYQLDKNMSSWFELPREQEQRLVDKDKSMMTSHDLNMEELLGQIQEARKKLRDQVSVISNGHIDFTDAQDEIDADAERLQENDADIAKHLVQEHLTRQKKIDKSIKQIKKDKDDLYNFLDGEHRVDLKVEKKIPTERKYDILVAKVLEGFT